MRYTVSGGKVCVYLRGRIDTNNAPEFASEMDRIHKANAGREMIIDAEGLEYISSSGLRVLMKLRRDLGEMAIINVSAQVYEIFDMTGFTTLFRISKKKRELAVDESQLIGSGANGRVYRLNDECIVKIYDRHTNPPEKIEREHDSARAAFLRGIPSAIPYDIVRVGSETGMVYELINAKTLGQVITAEPGMLEEYALKMSALLKKLHSTEFEPGSLPDARLSLRHWANIGARSGYYRMEDMEKVYAFINAIPERNTFIHGDFHPGNIMVSDGELILIDMGDASLGHPIVDLAGMFHIMKLISVKSADAAVKYTGMSLDKVEKVWDIFERDYFGTDDTDELRRIEESLGCYSMIRSLAGTAFSNFVREDKRSEFAKTVMSMLLERMDKAGPVP